MIVRAPSIVLSIVLLLAWTSSEIEAQSRRKTQRRAKPAAASTRKTPDPSTTSAPSKANGVIREAPLMQCPSVLGNGIKTQRLFCDVLTGSDPAGGLRVSIPSHDGPVTLLFTLHNRQTVPDETLGAASARRLSTTETTTRRAPDGSADPAKSDPVDPRSVFARYTATLRVVTPKGALLRQTVVQSEFRGMGDLVERVAVPGGVKPVAPTGSESIVLELAPDVTEVSLLGEKLTIERVGGTEVITQPGRPIAVVSQVQVEYRPVGSSGSRPRS
jgi:hypothetical protein